MSWRDKIAAVLAGKVGGPTPTGIHVYHSSPYDIERFDLSKIGTGEGAQSYGHGLYFAENPKVSGQGGQYWNSFSNRFEGPEWNAAERLRTSGFDRDAAIAQLRGDLERMQKRYDALPSGVRDNPRLHGAPTQESLARAQRELELLQSGAPIGPRTYEVNFRAKPEELLDWDKPLSAQPQVTDRLSPMFIEAARKEASDRAISATRKSRADELWGMVKDPTLAPGSFAYGRMPGSPADKSQMLAERGIPGIRYLDEGSRVTGPAANNFAAQFGSRPEAHAAAQRSLALASDVRDVRKWEDIVADLARPQTHNYVAFDPSKLDIMAKYGVVGATGGVLGAGAMGGTIDQSSYGERQ